jgi:hypothetical protein
MCPEVGTGEPAGTTRLPAVSAGAHWVDVRADPSPAERVGGRAGHEASSNQSSPCGGSRAGANVVGVHGSPSAASTARTRAESTTTAITLRRPPHGHDSTSVANTRRNSSARGTRPARVEPLTVRSGSRRRVAGERLSGRAGRSFVQAAREHLHQKIGRRALLGLQREAHWRVRWRSSPRLSA